MRNRSQLFAYLILLCTACRPCLALGTDACDTSSNRLITITSYCNEPVFVGQSVTGLKSTPPIGKNWALAGTCTTATAAAQCPATKTCDTKTDRCTCKQDADCPGSATCDNGICSSTIHFCVPKNWVSATIFPRTGCGVPDGNKLTCATGNCNGQLDCTGSAGAAPVTLFEPTLTGDTGGNYDASNASGYNVETKVYPNGGFRVPPLTTNKVACADAGCKSDLLATCPTLLQVKPGTKVIACANPCQLCDSGTADQKSKLMCTATIGTDELKNRPAATIPCNASKPSAGGSIALTSPRAITLNSTATLTIKTSDGYSLSQVEGCGSGSLQANSYTTGALTDDCTVTATFTKSSDSSAITSTFSFTPKALPTYRDMYCSINVHDQTYQISGSQGSHIAYSQDTCDADHDFVIPTYASGYSPPPGMGVCLFTGNKYKTIPAGANDFAGCTSSTQGQACGGLLSQATDARGYTCQTATYTDPSSKKSLTANLCLPPTTSGLGTCRVGNKDSSQFYEGVASVYNPAWLTAAKLAGGGTGYYTTFKQACPRAYAWQYDDTSAGLSCESTTDKPLTGFTVEYCPSLKPPSAAAAQAFKVFLGAKDSFDSEKYDLDKDGNVDTYDVIKIMRDSRKK